MYWSKWFVMVEEELSVIAEKSSLKTTVCAFKPATANTTDNKSKLNLFILVHFDFKNYLLNLLCRKNTFFLNERAL